MNIETRLRRLSSSVRPSSKAKDRVFSRIMQRIEAPEILLQASRAIVTDADAQSRVWERIAQVVTQSPAAFLDRVRSAILPPMDRSRQMWQALILPRLSPVAVAHRSYRAVAWVTAVAVMLVAVRISPGFFVAPPTRAQSAVLLLPTRGEIYLSLGGLWQPVDSELTLAPGMRISTRDGEASILLRDSGVIRLDRDTVIALSDLTESLEPAPEVVPTLSLEKGRIWVQGLIPANLRGITVASEEGLITVNEGSVSLEKGSLLAVDVFHRSVLVLRDAQETRLVAGDKLQLWAESVPLVRHIASSAYRDAWVAQNISRDAVHRKDIAHLQLERRVARAGILPTSKLYAVKRAAEAVDVALTLDGRARVEKQIAYAGVRLDEAAALMDGGATTAMEQPLREYRSTLSALAGTSTDTTEAQFLLKQAVSQDSAETAAAVAGDDAYLLKKTVLEALSLLPGETLSPKQVEASLFIDSLSTLTQALESGDRMQAERAWSEVQPSIALLQDPSSGLDAENAKEAQALLDRFASAATENGVDLDPTLVTAAKALLLPPVAPTKIATVAHLTEGQVAAVAAAIKHRVFAYRMPRSRSNQLIAELKILHGNPDAGSILRVLYHTMPQDSELMNPVRRSIANLKSDMVAQEGVQAVTP